LTNQNGNPAHVYTRTATASAVTFPAVYRGVYDLLITKDGFEPYTETDISINSSGSTAAELIEIINTPYELKVTTGVGTANFSWNNAPAPFVDDMESYQDFIIENIGDYIMHDLDGFRTTQVGDVAFPNNGYIGSFMVFNPSQTTPSLLSFSEPTPTQVRAHSGNKYLACFAAYDSVNFSGNNDWLILPKKRVVTGTVFKFWAKSVRSPLIERFKVAVSTTVTNPSDLKVISAGNYIQAPTTWTEFTYNLNAYAGQEVHVAIFCVSENAFMFMVDDIFLGVPRSKPTKAFSGYKVYLNGIEKATVQQTQYTFDHLAIGSYTAGVEASYTSGSSTMQTIGFTITEASNIIITDQSLFTVYPNPVSETLHIQTEKIIRQIDVVDMNGKVLKTQIGDSKIIDVQSIPAGNYIVNIHTETAIVPVRIVKQ
jgi:hypothetical protein